MAVIVSEGVEHLYAGNPTMQGEEWTAEYPPIDTEAKLLRNKITGQLYGKTEDLCYRSDILEPYFGDMNDADTGPAPSRTQPPIEGVFGILPVL